MIGKNLGYESGSQFLQIGDYQYNIRGWLSKFNQPSTATPGGTYRDLLAFELHYNTGASAIVSGTPNLFNGNISAMAWQVLGEGKEICAFAFTYDPMNRLTSVKSEGEGVSFTSKAFCRFKIKSISAALPR
ncbi:MAG: hypothetical protein SF052_05025 [Bacteroidia bacterium]|nr:hypothetical protein [Bacteroidia bacterium]